MSTLLHPSLHPLLQLWHLIDALHAVLVGAPLLRLGLLGGWRPAHQVYDLEGQRKQAYVCAVQGQDYVYRVCTETH